MKHGFTISEFAKLRNININSLRYYEKIGVLTPSYTDPKTGYRYYTPDQLSVLDAILCIDLHLTVVSYLIKKRHVISRLTDCNDRRGPIEASQHSLTEGFRARFHKSKLIHHDHAVMVMLQIFHAKCVEYLRIHRPLPGIAIAHMISLRLRTLFAPSGIQVDGMISVFPSGCGAGIKAVYRHGTLGDKPFDQCRFPGFLLATNHDVFHMHVRSPFGAAAIPAESGL